MATAIGAAEDDDVLSFRVRRIGGTVRIEGDFTVDDSLTFSAYLQSGGTGVRGTVEFMGAVTITDGADDHIKRHADLTAMFKSVTVGGTGAADNPLDPFSANTKNQGSWEVSDFLQFGAANAEITTSIILDKLVVSDDLIVRGGDNATEDATGPMLVVSELTVNSGATLTVGTEGQPDAPNTNNPIQLRVPLQKGDKDSSEDFTVKGTIGGTGAIWIAHLAAERGAAGFNLHNSADYMPDDMNKVDHDDCVMIGGGGTILNDVHVVAAGNVCVSLRRIGGLIAVGSVEETLANPDPNPDGISDRDSLTTDVIFRSSVTVDGSVQQWNDARIVFEGGATIDGSVTLDEGAFPEAIGATFGAVRLNDDSETEFVRETMPGMCVYDPDGPADDGAGVSTVQFSGVQFKTNATIEGDFGAEIRQHR